MEQSTHVPTDVNDDPGVSTRRRKRQRKPKNLNSESFNEILSAANVLSVNERVRLIKSLAGQHGLVVLTPSQVSSLNQTTEVVKHQGETMSSVKPNPLKDTIFDRNVQDARKSVKTAKTEAGGGDLPKDHPAMLQYAAALSAYKEQRKNLGIVADPHIVERRIKRPRRQTPERSAPQEAAMQPRSSSSTSGRGRTGVLGSVLQTMSRVTGGSPAANKSPQDDKEMKIL